jgi:hypothetical protein
MNKKNPNHVFIAGQRIVYLADLPHHLAHKGVPKDVARIGLFRLDERQGNNLIFKSDLRYANSYPARVLISPKTGEEICFVEFHGSRIMLEAKRYMYGCRPVTREDLETLHVEDGRTAGAFLEDEAKRIIKK